MEGATFTTLKLDKWLIEQCHSLGVSKPTPVQINCIPPILEGRDCIGCAKTGSGKTFAFALPVIQRLSKDPYGIFALVLTPTRELACQISDQFRVVGKPMGLRVATIVGGMDMVYQGRELASNPHIVVATPGRLADHLDSCDTFSLKNVDCLVVDEADRLLDGRFDDQLTTVFAALPRKRQTLLFSATITDTLARLREVALNNPFVWSAPSETATVEELDQRYAETPASFKDAYLAYLVQRFRAEKPKGSIVIFTDTCKSCQILGMTLSELGFDSLSMHSMISQKERVAALTKFRSSQVNILVATDVASRGLDIPTVQLVVNHNVPSAAKEYVHRVGRTARAGRGGLAVTLVTQHDVKRVHAIEALIGLKLKLYPINEKAVAKILTQVMVTKREQEIKLDETDFDEKKLVNKRKKLIAAGLDADEADREIERLRQASAARQSDSAPLGRRKKKKNKSPAAEGPEPTKKIKTQHDSSDS